MASKTTERVGNARLLKLAALLRTLPRKRFDYNSWVGSDWQGAPDLSCGTTACAMGWATTMPSFRRLGLRMTSKRFPRLGSGGDAIGAAVRLFAISDEEATLLFIPGWSNYDREEPGYSATPKVVARHIERFVARRQKKAKKAKEAFHGAV